VLTIITFIGVFVFFVMNQSKQHEQVVLQDLWNLKLTTLANTRNLLSSSILHIL